MIRCHLAQINTTVGDIEGNLQKSLAALDAARRDSMDLLILPEQTLPGYPAKDLLIQREFIRRCDGALEEFATATARGPAAVIGFPLPHEGAGTRLYNAAAFCRNGAVEAIYRKWLLPTYDVFDEDRYFDEGDECTIVEVGGLKVAVTICEDLWNDELYWSHRRYTRDPIKECALRGAEVIVNISASPFTMDKRRVRRDMMSSTARNHGLPIVQVNLVGANDDLIFDGDSSVYDGRGVRVAQGKTFEEDTLQVEVSRAGVRNLAGTAAESEPLEELRRALVLGIRDYVHKCGFRTVLIGLSGGIDSALVAVLAVEALGASNVRGVSMPSQFSSEHSKSDAIDLARNLGIDCTTIPIEGMFQGALEDLDSHLEGPGRGIAAENMQSRLRGLTLMSISNATGALVLTTGNKSELSVGYCTLYGDMCGGLAVLGDVPKLMVYDLARHINRSAGRAVIPESTITKPPSAELRPDQLDTDSLPPYEVLDPIIRGYVEDSLGVEELIARGHDAATVRRIVRLIHLNEYKRRQAAPTLKVTSRAFGYGWRMPIARR